MTGVEEITTALMCILGRFYGVFYASWMRVRKIYKFPQIYFDIFGGVL
jgi:hypothetical protein